MADPDQVRAMVDTVLQRFGHLDALVCNAGICLPGMLLQDVTDPQWARLLSVDTSGEFYAARAVLPHMIHRHAGRIITVSSMWGPSGRGLRGGLLRRQGGGNLPFPRPWPRR